jgi:uncharacterized protein
MSVEGGIKFGIGRVNLSPSPICAEWILEGNPVARNKLVSVSADGAASSYIWDCTAGRFNWFYEADETVYVIEGSVVVKDMAGTAHRLSAGDTIFFPAGTRAEWHVEDYIRKFALVRAPLPRWFVVAKRVYRLFKRLMKGRGHRANPSPSKIHNSEDCS